MNKISFPLKPQMKGPEVGDLHKALTALEYDIADPEQTAHRFGATTRETVAAFQKMGGRAGLELCIRESVLTNTTEKGT